MVRLMADQVGKEVIRHWLFFCGTIAFVHVHDESSRKVRCPVLVKLL